MASRSYQIFRVKIVAVKRILQLSQVFYIYREQLKRENFLTNKTKVVLFGMLLILLTSLPLYPSVRATVVTFSQTASGNFLSSGGTHLLFTPGTPPPATPPQNDQRFDVNKFINRPIPGKSAGSTTTTPRPLIAFPSVVADSIVSPGSEEHFKKAKGLNALDNFATHGFSVEPPDQALCVGNGFVIEVNNLVLKVFSASNFAPIGPDERIETLFGTPLTFVGPPFTVQGDPRCLFDTATGHWFISQLYFDFDNNIARDYIAVSTTSSPTGLYNIYFLTTTNDGTAGTQGPDEGCPCLQDQPLLGADANTIDISTNEFPCDQVGTCSGDDVFNGAQFYLIDKAALAAGAAASTINVAYFNIGLNVATDDGACVTDVGTTCWFSVQPASSPFASEYDTLSGGTVWATSALDFVGLNDNRIAVWQFTNTGSITTSPAITGNEQTLSSQSYGAFNPFQFATQKAGPIPLGDTFFFSAEGPIQPDDDRMQASVLAQGNLWTDLATIVHESNAGGTKQWGAAYWIIKIRPAAGVLGAIVQQNYVAALGEDITYPAIGVSKASVSANGIIAFTISGAAFFPSTGYARVNVATAGAVGGVIRLADNGLSPQDGFTEYGFPRWGDYSYAVASGGRVFFANEYIQFPNCSDATFTVDPTCLGTRAKFSNWGTSLNSVAP